MKTKYLFLCIVLTGLALLSCSKPAQDTAGNDQPAPVGPVDPDPDPKPDPEPQDRKESFDIPSQINKYYLGTENDLALQYESLPVNAATLNLSFFDSKHFALDETIRSISITSTSGNIAGQVSYNITRDETTVTNGSPVVRIDWVSDNPDYQLKVGGPAQVDLNSAVLLLAPVGSVSLIFDVLTDRYNYRFSQPLFLGAKAMRYVSLDFADPQTQPVRKVAILGDSISTFDVTGDNRIINYNPYYYVGRQNGSGEVCDVDGKEKTWWWKTIYDYSSSCTLDVNSSWQGTRVVHEIKSSTKLGLTDVGAGFVDRCYDFKDPDIVIIHGATNDMNQSTPLGDYDFDVPMGQLDESCFRSALVKTVKKIMTRYPGVEIIFVIGDFRGVASGVNYEQSIIAVADHFGFPYVDFYQSGYNPPKFDGSHPNAAYFDEMARTICQTCADYLP